MDAQNESSAESTGLVRLRSFPIVAKQPEFQSIRAPAGWWTDIRKVIVSCLEQRILPRDAPWPANQRSLWMSEPRLCASAECRAKLLSSQAALLQVPRPKAVRETKQISLIFSRYLWKLLKYFPLKYTNETCQGGKLMGFWKNSCNLSAGNRKAGLSLSIILAIASSMVMHENASAAENAHIRNKTVQLYMKKYQKNNVVFYSGSSLSRTTSVSAEDYFKGSPYICTPSGFGRTSRCYNRSAF